MTLKAQLTTKWVLQSNAPLWKMDGEYSTQDFARDHSLPWLTYQPPSCLSTPYFSWNTLS